MISGTIAVIYHGINDDYWAKLNAIKMEKELDVLFNIIINKS